MKNSAEPDSQLIWLYTVCKLIVLGFNDTSTLVGHFVSSPREREKRDRRDSRRDEREEKEWKWRNRRNKNIPPLSLPATRNSRSCPTVTVSQYQLDARWRKKHDTFAPPDHPPLFAEGISRFSRTRVMCTAFMQLHNDKNLWFTKRPNGSTSFSYVFHGVPVLFLVRNIKCHDMHGWSY